MSVMESIRSLFGVKPNTEEQSSRTKKSNKVSKLRKKGLGIDISVNNRDFIEPHFDIHEITKAYNTESYVRQALDKYVDLLFKEGWKFKGKEPKAVEYVKSRFQMMSVMTDTPIDQFFLEFAEDLVRYSNVFIYKARATDKNQLPNIPGVNIRGLNDKEPIAGYFLLNPTTISIARDKNGKILRYQQDVRGEQPKEFSPDEIIHIYYKKDRGKAFGTPFLVPVINDVKALREAEENVLRLIYQHIFPLYQYQVGLTEPGFEATDDEIEQIKEEIENMPMDGGLVVPERHNISAIGAEGHSLRAESYLQYFERRIFTGLGVSEVQMGRGGTANRATSDTLSTEMHDRIRAIQRVMKIFIDEFIINDLLAEGNFDPIGKENHKVSFEFEDIELESRIKKENHAIFKYEHNAITEDELRYELGEDPISDEERQGLHLNRVTIPKELATKDTNENNEADNQNQPENQHGKKSGPNRKGEGKESMDLKQSIISLDDPKSKIIETYRKDLMHHWELTKSDIISMVEEYLRRGQNISELNPKSMETIMHLTKTSMQNMGKKHNKMMFIKGARMMSNSEYGTHIPYLNYSRYTYRLFDLNSKTTEKLIRDLHKKLTTKIRGSSRESLVSDIIGVFKSMEYRLDFLAEYETNKAINYGYAVIAKETGHKSLKIDNNGKDCSHCEYLDDFTVNIGQGLFDQIPPYHPKCSVSLSSDKGGGDR